MSVIRKRRLEIIIETRSLTIVRTNKAKKNSVRCQKCKKTATFWATADAALIFNATVPQIRQLLQSSEIHFAVDNGVCSNSLAEYFKQEIRFIED